MSWQIVVYTVLAIVILAFPLCKAVKWAKKMPKGAFLFMALMPLISLFPIPTPQFKNLERAKQTQRKKQKQDDQ
ncbi:hypothetical protein [Pseudoalteromonas luteoviolacea]|uniref:Uncharacterized protein n=1 Tax=Pseudoalteromonas luteoviolacea DSM 6061 TaxID=1365250 RepID=A0A166WMA8_9GAMM|nr:hypothetical protein [Pseudoalteromonas luteoviolacea]KZN37648.1 hypothetical protein N475_02230 [Pseudoalteromonas luteoviolacea DSM 6061]MBE0386927.1 hypothetical protein [Pseudoalteromonas luteoviolacea DSM 6061]